MSHPYQSFREKHPGQKKARERVKERPASSGALVDRKADGGSVDDTDQPLQRREGKISGIKIPPSPPISYSSGGKVRFDKFARGGKAKGKGKKNHTHININVAPKGPDAAPPIMPDPAAGPIGPPPGGPMGAPMGGPPGAPPGGPPGQPLPPPMKRGGKVNVKGGAESGVGRLDKKKAYGQKAKG